MRDKADYIYEQLVDPEAKFKSSRLEGLWWLPKVNSQFELLLANRRDTTLQVELDTLGVDGEHASKNLLLAPYEIRALDFGHRRRPQSPGQARYRFEKVNQ